MHVSQKAALILTPALTDGSFSLISWQSFDGDVAALRDAAPLALHGAKSSWSQSLLSIVRNEEDMRTPKPLFLQDNYISGATYHHGTDHAHYVIGPLTAILRICASSENEREVAVQFARQQTTLGHVCYAVARGNSKSDITSIAQFEGIHRLDFLGVIVVKPQLYPNTLHRLSLLKNKYSTLHYLATGDEYYAAAIAIQAKLINPTEEIKTKYSTVSHNESAVLLLPKRDYETLIKANRYGVVFNSPLS
jgi:hypothetical protein